MRTEKYPNDLFKIVSILGHFKAFWRLSPFLLLGYPAQNRIHFTFPLQRADKEKAVAAVIVADLTDCVPISPVSCGSAGSRCSCTVKIAG